MTFLFPVFCVVRDNGAGGADGTANHGRQPPPVDVTCHSDCHVVRSRRWG